MTAGHAPQISDYEMVRCIGSGSYGEVWLARNVMGTYRAVKVIYRDRFDNERPYEREFEGIRRFEPISRTHPSQVDVLHIGRNDAGGYFYYVMELADDAGPQFDISGGEKEANASDILDASLPTVSGRQINNPEGYIAKTLRLELQRRILLPFDECLQLGLALATALEHLHGHGLIHRDIKPSNIIFVNSLPKLADIGLVAETEKTMSFVGTAGYLPPEGPGTIQGDIYSLGKVLYETCTGKDRQEFPELPSGLGSLPEEESLLELNEVLVRACHHDPRRRYSSAKEMRDDLEVLRGGASVKWKRAVERRLDWARKSVIATLGFAALTTAGYFFQRHQIRAAQRNLYVANMNLAQRDWDNANINRLAQLLEETRDYPDKGFEWFYWQRQLHLDLKTLRGHQGAVNAVAFSPDGQKLVTGSDDQTARTWDVISGQRVILLQGHTGAVTSVAYSSDGKRIITGSRDFTAKVWDATGGRELLTLKGHTGPINSVAISPSGQRIVTGSDGTPLGRDGTVRLWDAMTGEQLRVLPEKSKQAGMVAFSPDGQWIAMTDGGFMATLWDVTSGRKLSAFRGKGHITALAVSPDGQHLLAGSVGRWAEVWEISSREQLLTLQGEHQSLLTSVAFSPDGQRIVTASGDQTVIVWDAIKGKKLLKLTGHRAFVLCVALSPDGRRIATGSGDATAKIWDASTAQNPRMLPRHDGWVRALAFSPDGKRLLIGTRDKKATLWDTVTGQQLLTLTGHNHPVESVGFSPDGRLMATADCGFPKTSEENIARVWDSLSGHELLNFEGQSFVTFSPDGKWIATGSADHTARICDASTGQKRITLKGHTAPVQCVAFSPDGKCIATCARDRTAKIWDAATGRELFTIKRTKPDNEMLTAFVTFSPDGRWIAIANGDRTPKICDAATGMEVLALNGHADAVRCIAFSPDGRRIVTGSQDRTAKVWDALTGRELLTLEEHASMVAAVAFSPDGRRIVTGDHDFATRIWEAASPEQLARWRTEEAAARPTAK